MAVVTRCPGDGTALSAVTLGPDTPPWLCPTCSRGWWEAELSTSNRSAYNPHTRDFGDQQDVVHAQRDAEHSVAHDKAVRAHGGNAH